MQACLLLCLETAVSYRSSSEMTSGIKLVVEREKGGDLCVLECGS